MRQRTASTTNEKTVPSRSASRHVIFEGTRKVFFSADRPEHLIQGFKANGTPSNGDTANGSSLSVLRNSISAYLFEYIEGFHVPTHFIRKHSPTETLIRSLDILPVTVRIYNRAVGDLATRLGKPEASALDLPVLEHLYGSPNGPVLVNEFHLYAMRSATPEEFKQLNRIASKVNAVLRSLCDRRGLFLAELLLSFGRFKEQIVLAGDLTPDTFVIWEGPNADQSGRTKYLPAGENKEVRYLELLNRFSLKT